MSRFNSNYLRFYYVVVMLFALTVSPTVFAAIIPINVSFDLPLHGYGSYSQINETHDDIMGMNGIHPNVLVARSELSASIFADHIDIRGRADGSDYINVDFQEGYAEASADGSIVFEVDKGNLYDIVWNAGGSAADWSIRNPYFKISSAQDGVIVACAATFGCDLSPELDPSHPEQPLVMNGNPERRISLAAGSYTMSFSVSTEHGVGVTVPANFSLSLKEVPLPASIWLLISGIGVIQYRVFVRVFGSCSERLHRSVAWV